MSFRAEIFNKPSVNHWDNEREAFETLEGQDALAMYFELLQHGMHGLCFSAYEEGQMPGTPLSEAQILRRLNIIKPYTQWVRSFSCTEGNELIPILAKEMGFKTMVGAWLGNDLEKNEAEIAGLIRLGKSGLVDIAAVGNEVLYRKDLTEEKLLTYINFVKQQLTNIPVGYVDAYYEFSERPNIANACDVILCNCYPFWEGTSIDDALAHVKKMYAQAQHAGNGKKVIITETGWPNAGQNLRGAIPSIGNAIRYFNNMQLWAHDQQIEMFYFSSFDESWKTGPEGDVGAHWGLWDKNEELKYSKYIIQI